MLKIIDVACFPFERGRTRLLATSSTVDNSKAKWLKDKSKIF
jgi:hypothetical protein